MPHRVLAGQLQKKDRKLRLRWRLSPIDKEGKQDVGIWLCLLLLLLLPVLQEVATSEGPAADPADKEAEEQQQQQQSDDACKEGWGWGGGVMEVGLRGQGNAGIPYCFLAQACRCGGVVL
jgi:hypothetical protein